MHSRNTVRYYLAIAALLIFFFFSNDFGLIDIQKTALIMAVGIDREDNTFIVTTQIAVPEASSQGEQAQAVQIESRGDTVADALSQINVKTGWYPKLVFCNLIIIGQEAAKRNVFDALDFFLRDEYMSDGCLVATCEGTAKEILNTKTPIDPMSSVAAQKVLSLHAKQVGTAAPNTLREFSMGYFSNSKSSYMPILKPEKQQESSGEKSGENSEGGQEEKKNGEEQGAYGGTPEKNGGQAAVPAAAGGEESGSKSAPGGQQPEKVFSASETALFYDGVAVEKLNPEETFAFCMVKNKLRLASYAVESEGSPYTLNIKSNKPSIKFSVDDNSMAKLKIHIKATAGVQDTSFSQTVTELSNAGAVPEKVFEAAEKDQKKQITTVFDKSRKSRCDAFNILERLQKFENNYFPAFREDILDRLILHVEVEFESLR